MALATGSSLGPYSIVSLLGAGGMGEVYRARDSRLGRDVAIKVLPADLTTDRDRLRRFEQEARAAAALNHPHILVVYDVGTADVTGVQTPYVVSELLEGESLRERVSRGRLPVRVATELAIQIARALAAAHDHGIVHRDVKPENVLVTKDGAAKVLDFGLAKLRETTPPEADRVTTVSDARVGTGPGVVLGTVGYMAPEQVRGEPVDHRADLFALGCVLYELVTGQRAFRAATAVETLSAILTTEPPDLAASVPGVSGGLERIVRRCLEKDVAQRFQSARDLAFALEAVNETRSSASSDGPQVITSRPNAWRERAAWAAVVVAALGAGFAIAGRKPTVPSVEPQVVQFDVDVGEAGSLPLVATVSPRLSPDGTAVLLRLFTGGAPALFLVPTNGGAPSRLVGTEGAASLAEWALNGRQVYFRVGQSIRQIDVTAGGLPTTVGNAQVNERSSIAALADGVVLTDLGGNVLQSTRQGRALERIDVGLPTGFVASELASVDARTLLVTARGPDGSALFLARPGMGAAQLVQRGIDGRVVFVPPGVLLFRNGPSLQAQRLDPASGALLGASVTVARGVAERGFSASQTLLTHSGPSIGRSEFAWVDRATGSRKVVGSPGLYQTFDVSSDGRRIAVAVAGPDGQRLAVIDATLGGLTPITAGGARDFDPRWSADGARVMFGSARQSELAPYVVDVETSLVSPLFRYGGGSFGVDDVSRDGRWLLFHDTNPPHLLAERLDSGDAPLVVTQSVSGRIDQARMAPDSSAVAFHSNDSGRYEVFVVPFPGAGERIRISKDGGVQPTWRADGRELFYLALDGTLMSVDVAGGTPMRFGEPRRVLKLGSDQLASDQVETYMPAPDGRRFLVLSPTDSQPRAKFTVVVNWQQLLKRSTP